jgi:hypothetical protein
MLVSGSAVTLIFRTVMGGPLGGRFDFMYMKPMSIPDGAALLLNTLKYYAPDQVTTPELALYASTQVGGHPYYLYCLATSSLKGKSFKMRKPLIGLSVMRLKTVKFMVSGSLILRTTANISMLMMI